MKFVTLAGSTTLIALLLSMSCDYDHGVEPVRTKIVGNIVFVGPPPPSDVREARLVIVKNLPPENLTTDVIFSDPLPFNRAKLPAGNDTVRYELAVDPGVYPIAGVLWRHKDRSWNIADLLGLYIKINPNLTIDTQIAVDRDSVFAANIAANWELAKRDGNLAGAIRFTGDWRDDTDFFVLGCYSNIPITSLDFLTEVLINGRAAFRILFQRTRVDSLRFSIAVNSEVGSAAEKGTYKFISLFWKGKTSSLADIRAIGFYNCASDSLRPRFVRAFRDSTVGRVDFDADFASLPSGIDYHKDGLPCP